ncbi:MAG: hypothetical protein KatS3mg035_0127 [Bacteroidia bacterium]|nr:MAG: hypothetical protein KatS3mg035_0127 [Bacteroidia bacterium]
MKKLLFSLFFSCYFISHAQMAFNVQISSSTLKNSLWQAYKNPETYKNQEIKALSALASHQNHPLSQWFTITFQDSAQYLQWIQKNQNQILKIEPVRNYTLHTYNDPDIPKQYHHDLIKTFDAHSLTRGNGVVIGIIDTGIDFFHEELEGQFFVNSPEDINGNGTFEFWSKDSVRNGITGDLDGIDQDGNGYIDDVIGYDFTDQPRLLGGGDYLFEDPVPYDDNQHGTLVAGIIGAKANNNKGGIGIAPESKLMILRAFAASGNGEDDDIARAIVYATDNGVHVLNFSFGDIYPSQIMHAAIQYAYSRGVVMVASAGNGTGDAPHYPSGFQEVISVSASMFQNDREFLWPLSSYGGTVDLCAPGAGIYTTDLTDSTNRNKHGEFSGTSTSAPMVSAAAALLKSINPALNPIQIKGILTSTAQDIQNPGWDYFTGAGRLDILKALQFPTSINVQIHQPIHLQGFYQDTIPIQTTVIHPLLQSFTIFYFQGDSIGNNRIPLFTGDFQHIAQTNYVWNVQNLPEGVYTVGLEIRLRNSQTLQIRSKIFIDRTPPTLEIKVNDYAYENQERKWLMVYRANEPIFAKLKIQEASTQKVYEIPYDKITQNGMFLIGNEILNPGFYAYKIIAKNSAGLIDSSQIGQFLFEPYTIPTTTLQPKNYKIPAGYYLPEYYDFDNDDLPEILYNEFDSTGSYSNKIYLSEWNAQQFVKIDSLITDSPRLPKDVWNKNLLSNLRDSIFLYQNPNPYLPKTSKLLNEKYFPAQFADTDQDGQIEIIAKNFKDYVILEQLSNGEFSLIATLADTSSDYIGSTAPRVVIKDLDLDGKLEIVFGDYDGDVFIYENVTNNQYALKAYFAGELEKSSDAIVAGDLNGNGYPELIVASKTSNLRNADFEYDIPYWKIQIYEATANDTYQEVWQTYIYNHHSDTWNTSMTLDLNNDGTPEWLFSPFPTTYVLDYVNGNYEFLWFHYGSRQNSYAIVDMNYNAFPEIGLTTTDSTEFFEWSQAAVNLPDVAFIQIETCADSVFVSWNTVPNIYQYLIWKAEPQNLTFQSFQIVNQNYWSDTLQSPKWIAVSSYNSAYNPPFSNLSYAVYGYPHPPFTIDSVQIINEKTLKVYTSQKLHENILPHQILLNDNPFQTIVIQPQFSIVQWKEGLQIGNNTMSFSKDLSDEYGGCLSENQLPILISYIPQETKILFLTQWQAITPKKAILRFNEPISPNSIALNKFNSSVGQIEQVQLLSANEVELLFKEAILGNMGYEVRVKIKDLWNDNGYKTYENVGDIAVFATSPTELKEALVYPNPVILNKHEKVTFAQIPNGTEIEIYTLSGRYIQTIKEQNSLGGVDWNLKDIEGKRIYSGIYLFKAKHSNTEFIGQFSVVE